MMRHEIDAGGRWGWKAGRAERLRRGTSQLRLKWIIVKVPEQLRHLHPQPQPPDTGGDRGWESLSMAMEWGVFVNRVLRS